MFVRTDSIPPNQILLEMAYASAQIRNPDQWSRDIRIKRVKKVELIFTNYPLNRRDWRTHYDTLLHRRMDALFELIPALATDTTVEWHAVLQTDCQSAKIARERFHGVVLTFQVVPSEKLKNTFQNIREIISGKIAFADSIVFKVFERNRTWSNMLVVNDWTGSMYPYGAQAVLWHRLNLNRAAIKHFLFFNDGDMRPDDRKTIGQTGGLYLVSAAQLSKIAETLRQVMLNGYGGDPEENDVEALLYGIKQVPQCSEVILIADNNSAVRDISLLPELASLKMPIRVILCGTSNGAPPNADYLNIARQTGGSLHTIQEDITQLARQQEGAIIPIGQYKYRLENGQFVRLTDQ